MKEFDGQAIIYETERMLDAVKKLVRESSKRKGPAVSQAAAVNVSIETLAVTIAPTSGKSRETLVNLIMDSLAKQTKIQESKNLANNAISKAKKR
jgi:hypothetical protein